MDSTSVCAIETDQMSKWGFKTQTATKNSRKVSVNEEIISKVKTAAVKSIQSRSKQTLEPLQEESLQEDGDFNIFSNFFLRYGEIFS